MSDVKTYRFPDDTFKTQTRYVLAADYLKLEAENQALREEVTALRARVVVVPERDSSEADEAAELRAFKIGWNACLDELARLNGKAVSMADIRPRLEAIASGLRQLGQRMQSSELSDASSTGRLATRALLELSALLDEGKEASDA
ncbi:hypothetical protein [Pseudomonas citronellolis]|uniref:hypothetical protein n=1 Tax=Pseudomonas citronellolis TaxID=53408 RepID=UPI0023E35700|nr:hypothetical protein [Pseudomonas citronellolis]MDF3932771.1 hypothetical protein [Pseudomonas citronellolis]